MNIAGLTNQLIYQLTPAISSFNQLVKNLIPSKNKFGNHKNKDGTQTNMLGNNFESYFELYDLIDIIKSKDINLCNILMPELKKIQSDKIVWKDFDLAFNAIMDSYFKSDLKITHKHPTIAMNSNLKLLTKNLFYQNGLPPVRGFKTVRARVNYGRVGTKDEPVSIFNKIFKKDGSGEKISGDLDDNEILKKLLTNDALSPTEKDKLKVSFAEGYIAGESKKKQSSKKYNILAGVRELIIFVIIIAMLFSVVGGPLKQMIFGNGSEVHPEDIDVTFDDVHGIPEAKDELTEVVDFLKDPQKFSVLGGKLPKGVLLVGPPGTGKTLLARAVAGEAGVPFFHAVGSEFDEVLVGQGARRVRNLFSAAKEKAPCVVFIDEIDSVGAKRSKSEWHPYANQTVNQLLAEMDGFHKNEGIIVLGATNRKEDLDRALVRPGRFDMEIHIPPPDLKGRADVFKYYLNKVKTGKDIDVARLARGTTGYTGADIENMVNQSALRAAKDNMPYVTMKYLEEARDKILMGPEKKSRIPDFETNKITAYHEAGHTLVSYYTKEAIPLHKVTIIPRGLSLGHTASLPDKEMHYQTKSQICATLDTILGGRAAEELIFGNDKITSGATDDLRKATEISSEMVKSWGMSEKVGLRVFDDSKNALVAVNDVCQSVIETMDHEITRLLNESYDRAKIILKTHAKEHHALAEALLKYETLDFEEIKAIIEGRKLTRP